MPNVVVLQYIGSLNFSPWILCIINGLAFPFNDLKFHFTLCATGECNEKIDTTIIREQSKLVFYQNIRAMTVVSQESQEKHLYKTQQCDRNTKQRPPPICRCIKCLDLSIVQALLEASWVHHNIKIIR